MQNEGFYFDVKECIKSIAERHIIEDWMMDDYIDLYGGKSGVAIFYASMFQFYGEERYKESTYELVSEIINDINLLSNSGSLSGVAGVTWMLQHLVNINFIAFSELEEYILTLTNKIVENINLDSSNKNYDLMHGLLGQLITLKSIHQSNKLYHPEILLLLEKSIHYFADIASHSSCGTKLYWLNPFEEGNVVTGMAHGMASIIWYLSDIINDNILSPPEKDLAISLINKSATWLVESSLEQEGEKLKTPNKIYLKDQAKKKYSLAWCHGSLGVAIAFVKAGKILRNDSLFNTGLSIAESASEITLEYSSIHQGQGKIDSTFCHGTYGVFLIFYLLYEQTESSKLKSAYQYWLQQILDNFTSTEKYYNLNYAYPDNGKMKWNVAPGLLTGLSGNGLVLLTYYLRENNFKSPHNWFDIFI